MERKAAARFVVTGRVQGVGFRWWTVRAAGGLGIVGWVRNREDGAVEVEAVGSEEALAALEEALRGGPPHAVVEDLQREPRVEYPEYADFRVRYA